MIVTQEAYERALGAYLVQFNVLEVKTSEVHFGALHRLGLDHLFRSEARFVERLVPLEIALTALEWSKPDFVEMRRINGRRNELAHGHLHTDPDTGDLVLEGAHKIKRSAESFEGQTLSVTRSSKVEAPDISAFANESMAIMQVNEVLDQCLAHFWFDDIDGE